MYTVMFSGGIIPRLRLWDETDNIELARRWAKAAMEGLDTRHYHWCGIFLDGKLVEEITFTRELIAR